MENPMLELWFIRHGQSTYNHEKRIQGQQDAPLSDYGRRQARALQPRLASQYFDKIYSSPLQRAMETARIALPDAAIIPEARIKERKFGSYEGKRVQDLSPQELEGFQRWKRNPELPIPDGESQGEFWARIEAWLHDVPAEGKIIAFCHGGVIYALMKALFALPTAFGRGFNFDNAGITVIQYHHAFDIPVEQRHFRLLRANDTAHVESMSDLAD